jgi:hypothetical protein
MVRHGVLEDIGSGVHCLGTVLGWYHWFKSAFELLVLVNQAFSLFDV